MSERVAESKVTKARTVSIPAFVRKAFNVQPGDVIVWRIREGKAELEFRKAKGRAFDGFVPFDFGFKTNGTKDHDVVY